uniref:Hyaluronan-mediated motility receptor n=1 Tax=Phallusia mammillata TaxID=59560 RepID=A0A6F9DE20_9ASCI|nr:hyaluronan-mediated motility receptor [Phallusia mammillata]
MSFPKAAIKRFNDNAGSGPAPGQYTLSEKEKTFGVLKFENYTDRFKPESTTSTDGNSDVFVAPESITSSKKKLNFNGPASLNNSKRESKATTIKASPKGVNKEKQAYEKEIRQLLQQCSDREKDLKISRQEVARLEGRVTSLSKDKLSLGSEIKVAEKNIAALQKKNDFLMTKEVKEKRNNDLELDLKRSKSQLTTYKQQLERDRIRMQSVETDVTASKARIAALQQANSVLEELNQDIEKHSDDVGQQISALQGVTDKLRADNARLQDDLHCSDAKLKSYESKFAETLNAALATIISDYENKLKNVNDALDTQVERVENANTKITKLSDVVVNHVVEKKSVEKKKDKLLQEFQSFKSNHEECEAKQTHMKSELLSYVDKLKEANSIVESLRQDLSEKTEEHSRIAEERGIELNSLKEELKSQESSLQNERERCDGLNERVLKYSQRNEALQCEVEDLRSSNEKLKCDLDSTKVELGTSKNNETEAATRLSDLEAENEALNERMAEIVLELNQYKENLDVAGTNAEILKQELESLKKLADSRLNREEHLQAAINELKQSAKAVEDSNQAKLTEFTRRILETQKKLNQKDNESKANKLQVSKLKNELDEKDVQYRSSSQDFKQKIDRVEKLNKDLEEKYEVAKEELKVNALPVIPQVDESETQRWRSLYEELLEKVKPFQSQLDAYSQEKSMLTCETNAAQAELSQLGRKYAELLGHQNQKQKIRHVVKIKEENLGLKQDNLKLKNQVSSLKRQLIEGRKTKMDPSVSFQNQKENTNPSLSHKH